jgi:DNA-binding response OmpR family regulator
MPRVLFIDDDMELCDLTAQYLETEGFDTEAVHTGLEGVERALSDEYALVVLDVMLPGIQGFEVLRRIRVHSRIPVLMLTARGEAFDRILGLELGADDHLSGWQARWSSARPWSMTCWDGSSRRLTAVSTCM